MAFPNDLNDVSVFKIHPAIGVARLARNDDYYEFFQQQALPAEDRVYMSDVGGVPTMKRQAVQFKVFAYDSHLNELGELSAEDMANLGLSATWSASVGNRKLLNYANKKGEQIPAITASGSATGADTADLVGVGPFGENQQVTLGHIRGDGLFLPGNGGITLESPNSPIAPYPANQDRPLEATDDSADGSVGVELSGTAIPVIPACVVCAPQQHSPDVNAGDPNVGSPNLDWTESMRPRLGITGVPPQGEGAKMDEEIIATTNGEFNPGMETSFQTLEGPTPRDNRAEFTEAELPGLFYDRGQNFIGVNEIRPQYALKEGENGALPGQLTSGLCSTWQGDLVACLNYWTAEFPYQVSADGVERPLFRENCDSTGQKGGPPEWLNEHADEMGVARNTSNDVNNLVETERCD